MIGIPLGVLIGVVTGFALVLLLRTIIGKQRGASQVVATVIAQVLGIPAFWFGGSWVGTSLMQGIDAREMMPYYVTSLAVTFGLIAVWPLLRLVIAVGQAIAAEELVQTVGGEPALRTAIERNRSE